MNVHIQCFLYGVIGNLAVEVLRALGYFHRRKFHAMYFDWRFWVVRGIFFAIAGLLALALSVDGFSSRVLAFNAGAGCTLTIGLMARRPPAQLGGKSEDD